MTIVEVENNADANSYIDKIIPLPTIIDVSGESDFVRFDGRVVMDSFYHTLSEKVASCKNGEKVVVKGLSTFLKLKGKDAFSDTLKTLFDTYKGDKSLVVLCYQCKTLLEELKHINESINSCIRYIAGATQPLPKVIFYNDKMAESFGFKFESGASGGAIKIGGGANVDSGKGGYNIGDNSISGDTSSIGGDGKSYNSFGSGSFGKSYVGSGNIGNYGGEGFGNEGEKFVFGINAIPRAFENACGGVLRVFTKRAGNYYGESLIKITDNTNSFEVLKRKIPKFSSIDEHFGEDEYTREGESVGQGGYIEGGSERIGKSGVNENTFWDELLKDIGKYSWADFVAKKLGSVCAQYLRNWSKKSEYEKRLVFLALKTGLYSTFIDGVMQKVDSEKTLLKAIWSAILDYDYKAKDFWEVYEERKELLRELEDAESDTLADEYFSLSRAKGDGELYYLTDCTKNQKNHIIKTLATPYWADISHKSELLSVLSHVWGKLYEYLGEYDFGAGGEFFTKYFDDYKWQKVTNKLDAEFLKVVEEEATRRSYNGVRARSHFVSKLDKSESSKLYFIDALGVEYISYIQKAAQRLGLSAKVDVARSELPTLTFLNKEFLSGWAAPVVSEKHLDDVKHKGDGGFDYQNEKLPLHIVKELEIIDAVLSKIKSELFQGNIAQAYIVSDHGASRLCVIYGAQASLENNGTKYKMEEMGQHSGRCCPAGENEKAPTPSATKQNGFWCLANYERFKGGRAANVEVHGGATLEEVLVPIFTFKRKFYQKVIVTLMVEGALVIERGKAAVFKFSSSAPLKSPSITLGGQGLVNKSEKVRSLGGNIYEVETSLISKAGTYTVTVKSEESEDASLTLRVEKQGFSEIDMGI